MQVYFATQEMAYDGSQLASHFGLRRFGQKGDCIVVFRGSMEVVDAHMADLEDLLAHASIRSPYMLHFIVELFGVALETAVLAQRLLARIAAQWVHGETGKTVRVEGDDLYAEGGKLSVSIAAPSPLSCLIHFGLNIETHGVPVKAAGLKALGADPDRMAKGIAKTFAAEMDSVKRALCKVRGLP